MDSFYKDDEDTEHVFWGESKTNAAQLYQEFIELGLIKPDGEKEKNEEDSFLPTEVSIDDEEREYPDDEVHLPLPDASFSLLEFLEYYDESIDISTQRINFLQDSSP
ncbi:MAG: hypothetical protein LIO65_02095 [Odoribacter sp.]|nr:hypothetical protein [Odoribacter sp.]